MPHSYVSNESNDPQEVKQIEAAYISALFGQVEGVRQMLDTVEVDDLSTKEHTSLYQVIREVANDLVKTDRLDYALVIQKAIDLGMLRDCGGPEYILTLAEGYSDPGQIDGYAARIRELSRRRNVDSVASSLLDCLANDFSAKQYSDALASARRLVDLLSADSSDLSRPMSDVSADFMRRLDRTMEFGPSKPPFMFGIPELDGIIEGLEPGHLCIIGARPSQGKTAMGVQVMWNHAQSPNSKSYFLSLEMSDAEIHGRLISMVSGIPSSLLKKRTPTKGEYDILSAANKAISNKRIHIESRHNLTIGAIRSSMASARRKMNGMTVAVVDYLQLVAPARGQSRYDGTTEVARLLKQTAQDFNIPIVALAQLTRRNEQENSRPRLSDLRDSGGIEEAADQVILLHNPNFYAENKPALEEIEAIVAKSRHGGTGLTKLQFDRKRTTFISSVRPIGTVEDPGSDPFSDDTP